MTTTFPTSIDDNTTLPSNLIDGPNGSDALAAHPNNLADAVKALEAKVGVDASAVTTSLDYFMNTVLGRSGNDITVAGTFGVTGNVVSAINITQGTLTVGADDTTQGVLSLLGGTADNGGKIRFYDGATPSTVDIWDIYHNGHLTVGSNVTGIIGQFKDISGVAYFGVGQNDLVQGVLQVFGPSTGDTGGQLLLYNSGDHDAIGEVWTLESFQGSLRVIRSESSTPLVFRTGGSLELWETTGPAGQANKGMLFVEDNGAGKTRLVVRFGSGADKVLATED